jgi:hypothetical protein
MRTSLCDLFLVCFLEKSDLLMMRLDWIIYCTLATFFFLLLSNLQCNDPLLCSISRTKGTFMRYLVLVKRGKCNKEREVRKIRNK